MREETYWEKKERQEAEANVDLDEFFEASQELEKEFWQDLRKENIWK